MESDFLYMVETELANAREKHNGPIHTPHEAYGVIAEEVAEFFDEVRAQSHSKSKMLRELVQIAAMCYRAAEDLGLVECEADEPDHPRIEGIEIESNFERGCRYS